jgi:hypothetical protein
VKFLDEIVDRAIQYTDRVICSTPAYRERAIAALRRLGQRLAEKSPGHPAVRKLSLYLDFVARPRF